MALGVLDEIKHAAGAENIAATLGYVGTPSPNYPVNSIFLWTSGPHEAVLLVALKPSSQVAVSDLEEQLRKTLPEKFPGSTFSFEAGDVVSEIMNFGAPTPVEVSISGPNLAANRTYAEKLQTQMRQIRSLRDLQYGQPLDYPSLIVNVDRERAGQLGVTVEQVGRSFLVGTSSSRYVTPNYWRDPSSGIAYQVQVEVPQSDMASIQDVQNIPAIPDGSSRPLIGDVANVAYGTEVGEYDRLNGLRMVTLTANTGGEDLGRAAAKVDAAIRRTGSPPRGVTVNVRGQVAPMRLTLANLGLGLALAVLVIFLLLSANFQSLRLGLVVLSTIPAVICGVIIALLVTRTTLNIQSFMGAIMAIGVAVANAILLITFAEAHRRGEGAHSMEAAIHGAQTRMRPILMTSMAMVSGMIPMAVALGRGAEGTAPLGRAVIGGLVAATFATLTILPCAFSVVQERATTHSASLDADDPESRYWQARRENRGNQDGEAQ